MSKRKVMKFLVPTQISDLLEPGFDRADRREVLLYVNPSNFKIDEKKIASRKLTKGGYLVQYWGEELPVITATGTTGSGGIDAINILRDVYRNEQRVFKRLLIARGDDLESTSREAIENVPADAGQLGTTAVLDSITGGGFSQIVDGVSSTVQAVTEAFNGVTGASSFLGPHTGVALIPSLGAFAVSVDLYFQREKFRGYFENFSVTEDAMRPGHFEYSFTFIVTKRFGKRKNFMLWHRKPRRGPNGRGETRAASIPTDGPRLNELSFESDIVNRTQRSMTGAREGDENSVALRPGTARSTIKQTGDQNTADVPNNNVGVDRRGKIKG